MSGAISKYIREHNNITNQLLNTCKSDDFVSANVCRNESLQVIRHYFEFASMTCAYSYDKLIIHSNNRKEFRFNLSLINHALHSSNYKQAITENFQRAMADYNILYNLQDDIARFGFVDIYDPKVAEMLAKNVNIILYNDDKLQRWAKFQVWD